MDPGWAFYEALIDEHGNVGPYYDRKPDFSYNPEGEKACLRAVEEMQEHEAQEEYPVDEDGQEVD